MLVALEHIQNRGGEKHGPVARLGFGRRHYQFALYPVYLPFYPQRPGAEVQVIPMERQDLAPAQASRRWISSGVSTFISLDFAGGSLQLSAGLRKISFSSTALSRAAWRVVWMPRTVWSDRPSP